MNPIMPFLSETLYCALPGKDKTHLAYIKFPECAEVYFIVFNTLNTIFNTNYLFLFFYST